MAIFAFGHLDAPPAKIDNLCWRSNFSWRPKNRTAVENPALTKKHPVTFKITHLPPFPSVHTLSSSSLQINSSSLHIPSSFLSSLSTPPPVTAAVTGGDDRVRRLGDARGRKWRRHPCPPIPSSLLSQICPREEGRRRTTEAAAGRTGAAPWRRRR